MYVNSGALAPATVPEPASALCLTLGLIAFVGWRFRRAFAPKLNVLGYGHVLAVALATICGANSVQAAFTLDRNYRLGGW